MLMRLRFDFGPDSIKINQDFLNPHGLGEGSLSDGRENERKKRVTKRRFERHTKIRADRLFCWR